VNQTTGMVRAIETLMAEGNTDAVTRACDMIEERTCGAGVPPRPSDIPLLAILATACEFTGEVARAREAANRWVLAAPLDPYAHYKLALVEQRLKNYPEASRRLYLAASLAGPDDDVLYAVRDALSALDVLQLQQIIALREVDYEFRLQLQSSPESALEAKGFALSAGAFQQLLAHRDDDLEYPLNRPRLLS